MQEGVKKKTYHDLLMQAVGGLLALEGEPEPEIKDAVPVDGYEPRCCDTERHEKRVGKLE